MTPLFIFMLFLPTIVVKCDIDLNCQDLRNTSEFEKGESAVLKVILPGKVSKLSVIGPKGAFECGLQFFPKHPKWFFYTDSSELTWKALYCDNATIVAAVIPNFDYYYAGIWNFGTSDRRYGIIEYHQINAYETEYDKRFHNKIIEVRNEEYIMVILNVRNKANSNCMLINEETSARYNLSDVVFKFPENEANLVKVDSCGFHMLVGHGTQGNWSLVHESGWRRHKAHFEVRMNSSIVREKKSSITNRLNQMMGSEFWSEGFEAKFPFSGYLFSEEFVELENPSKDIIRLSEVSQDDIDIGVLSHEDNGIWKIRFGEKDNLGILTEIDLSVLVRDLPSCEYRNILGLRRELLYSQLVIYTTCKSPRTCTLKYGNESLQDCKIEKNDPMNKYTIRIAKRIIEKNDTTKKWELSMDYVNFRLNVLLVRQDADEYTKPYVWYSRQMQKYVNRGGTLKVRCLTDSNSDATLEKCSLVSPQGTMYIQGGSPFVSKRNSYDNGEHGCEVTFENVQDEHNGTWTCKMDYENGPELQSSVPVRVTESDLIPVVEQAAGTVCLQCQLSPGKRFRKIVLCEWFHENDSFKENPTNYIISKNDKNCSLEIKNPSEKDVGIWECSIRLDLGGNRNATVEFEKIFMKEESRDKISSIDEP